MLPDLYYETENDIQIGTITGYTNNSKTGMNR